jgi:hypothetical protein
MKKVINVKRFCFLSLKGYVIPKYIWIGKDDFGNELTELSKKWLKSKIKTNNAIGKINPELLKSAKT